MLSARPRFADRLKLAAVRRLARLLGVGGSPARARWLENLGVLERYNSVIGEFSYDERPFYVNLLRLSPSEYEFLFRTIDTDDCYGLRFVEVSAPTVIDIGTHIGVLPRVALSRFPDARVVTLEPDIENEALTRRNLESFPPERVTSLHGAIGKTRGQQSFYVSSQIDWRSTLLENPDALEKRGVGADEFRSSYTVDVETLSSLLDRLELDRIDLLKMTVPGDTEAELLADGIEHLRSIRPTVIGVGTTVQNSARVDEQLIPLGYERIPRVRPDVCTYVLR